MCQLTMPSIRLLVNSRLLVVMFGGSVKLCVDFQLCRAWCPNLYIVQGSTVYLGIQCLFVHQQQYIKIPVTALPCKNMILSLFFICSDVYKWYLTVIKHLFIFQWLFGPLLVIFLLLVVPHFRRERLFTWWFPHVYKTN